jgi:hypothetical protein
MKMNHQDTTVNPMPLRLGFWSALLIGMLFVLYIVCFVGILGAGPAFVWTNMQDFVTYTATHSRVLKYAAYAGMLLFCAAWVVLSQSAVEYASPARKPLARIGVTFGGLFAVSSGMNYFVQLSAVRLNLQSGTSSGLEQWVMGNPVSGIAAINMLGWTFLLGLSCLFVAFAFEGRGAARVARWSLLACSSVCFAGGFGYLLNNTLIIALCMYPLLGGAVLAVSASLCALFAKTLKTTQASVTTPTVL